MKSSATLRDEMEAIREIRAYANDRYNDGLGWDAVIEAFTDGDILEYVSNADGNIVQAIKDIQEWIDIRKEMEDNCQF